MDILKNKNKILAVVAVILIIIIAIAGITLFNQNTLTQTKDTWTHEAGQELNLDAAEFFDADEEKAAQITFDTSAVDVNTTGEYTATASFKGKTFEIKVTVEDTSSPKAEFTHRYLFTNDMANADLSNTNGVHGFDILTNYLASLGLTSSDMGGGWIDSSNDWYWYIAYDPIPIDTSGNEW